MVEITRWWDAASWDDQSDARLGEITIDVGMLRYSRLRLCADPPSIRVGVPIWQLWRESESEFEIEFGTLDL